MTPGAELTLRRPSAISHRLRCIGRHESPWSEVDEILTLTRPDFTPLTLVLGHVLLCMHSTSYPDEFKPYKEAAEHFGPHELTLLQPTKL